MNAAASQRSESVRLSLALSLAALFHVLGIVGSGPPAAFGQTDVARVRVERENFRRQPAGSKVATVLQGTNLRVLERRDRWVKTELAGWLPADAIGRRSVAGFEWVVTVPRGAALRAEPNGPTIAELDRGFALEREEERGGWVRIRREAWIWAASLEPVTGAAPAVARASSPAAEAGGVLRVGPAPVTVYARPEGDTVATLAAGRAAEVLGRTGDWYRVRVDGWVYGPEVAGGEARVADTGELSAAQLRAESERYKGALVRWRVQFIALRRAEKVRTDFKEGEPYILARGPAGDRGFVYLAVPPQLLARAEAIQPLSYLTVVGRVRTGRSDLMGAPVIDLSEIESDVSSR